MKEVAVRRREGGCGRGRTGVGGEGEEGLARVGAPKRGREGCLEEEVGGERGRGGRWGRNLSGCASRGRGQAGLGVQEGLSFPPPRLRRRPRRPETSALWQLLFRVLSPLPAGSALASIALDVQARLVKSALCSQGYPRLALAQLPEDGSQGSRELLLALSWLLARGPVPEQMLARTRVPLGDEMTVCQCEALASLGPPAPHVETEGPVDVRHVQWLMGKLRFRWRQLVSSQQEQCALLSKIHLYTHGCHSDQSLGHLSVTEAEMLRDPEGGQQPHGPLILPFHKLRCGVGGGPGCRSLGCTGSWLRAGCWDKGTQISGVSWWCWRLKQVSPGVSGGTWGCGGLAHTG
ncbi:tubulin epsilon and delta complex protein 1 isoform X4 [Trachypithecus francoisi]|uniref:tubulin epsilon and delta complex protein 1 isoform X4 n=1 Tax=Trachypithecus francoisi TaxID=54180 RepID=UPI00141B179E|nr:tubulin epsilon and delta complex protein 1 isoform X4 [Trachypithecus francoisi]